MLDKDETEEEFWDKAPEDPQGKSDDGNDSEGEKSEGETVKVGEKEVPLNELAELISKADEYKNLQEKYPSIKFDGLAKDYTEKSSRLAEFEKVKKKVDSENQIQETDKSEIEAKEQVMKILTPEIEGIIQERLKNYSKESSYEDVMSSLQKEFDGEGEKIKFDREKTEKFMKDEGITNPKIAFEYENRESLKDYKQEPEKNIPFSEKISGSGMNVPIPKKLETFDDAEKATEEMLKGSE